MPERATHDYERHSTSSLYAALELGTGKVIGKLHSRQRGPEFKKFLATIEHEVPDELDVRCGLSAAAFVRQLREPALNEVQPRARGRGEMQYEPRVGEQPAFCESSSCPGRGNLTQG